MSKRFVIAQVLKKVANDFDQQGKHQLADLITEDLIKISSNDKNIREAFLKGLLGKNLFKNIQKSLQSGTRGYFGQQLNFNKYLLEMRKPGQNVANLNQLKLKIQADTTLNENFKKNLLNELDRRIRRFSLVPAQELNVGNQPVGGAQNTTTTVPSTNPTVNTANTGAAGVIGNLPPSA